MFGQDDNQNDTSGLFGPQDDGLGAPAPGAPSGPVNQQHTGNGAPTNDTPSAPPSSSPDTDDLLNIKQEALHALTPLVGHLEQSPEEKFRTTMMMIQASDDQGLIKEAYAAAQEIHDEKARAQALLDVVNEINYFTQQHSH